MWSMAHRTVPSEPTEKMPVKVDSSRCCSPTPFFCDVLNEFEHNEGFPLSTSYEDDWGSLIPTPPQSPGLNLDFFNFKDSFLDDGLDMDFDQKLINHDCMWSGQCSEGTCNKSSYKPLSNSWTRSFETTFNLSTSPINTFSDLSPYDLNMPENSLANFMEEEVPVQPTAEGNVYAMANDHSYESSSPVSIKEESEDENTQTESSLIRNPIKVLNGKITKGKRVSNKKPLIENSILNPNVSNNRPKASKNETSVLKPTIISVGNFKSIDCQSIHPKLKLAIKKKNIKIIDAKSCNTARPTIQIKKVPNFATNISVPMISPCPSDSEESTLSFSSSGDDNRKTSPPFRRREHNDSERKRRDHLRNSFNFLKDQIPKLKQAEKRPPRIMILHEATNTCNNLTRENADLMASLQAAKEAKNRLLSILSKMKNY